MARIRSLVVVGVLLQLGSGCGAEGSGAAPGTGGTSSMGGASGSGTDASAATGGASPDGGSDSSSTSDAEGCASCPSGQHCVDGICDAVADVESGGTFTCARMLSGRVRCWGSNNFGSLGDGTQNDRGSAGAVLAIGGTGPLTGVTQLGVGAWSACGRHAQGTLTCWGSGYAFGSSDPSAELPVAAPAANVEEYRGGWQFGVVRKAGGTVEQLGGMTTPVGGISNAIGLDTSFDLSCARLGDQTVRCWDDTQGAAAAAILDAQADGGTLTGALDLAVADHTGCAILTKAVACWGEGFAGALGDGSTLAHETTAAVRVLGSNGTGSLTDAVMIDGRGYGFCVIRSGGTVWCWGDAVSEPGGSGYPTATGVSSAVDVAVGDLHVCALHQDGSVSCWGSNQFGQLGGGTIGGNSETPVKVLGL